VGLEIPAEQLILEEELSKDTQGEDIGRFGKVFKGRCYGLEVSSLDSLRSISHELIVLSCDF
jgi:hypothetical protein